MIEAFTTKLDEYEEIESLDMLQFYIYDLSQKLIVDVYKADFTRDDYHYTK